MNQLLSTYRLNSYSELECLISKTGSENFQAYREFVYSTLNRIKPGEEFVIRDQVEGDVELFIKIACLYISEAKENSNVLFSDDYEKLVGMKTDNNHQNNKTYDERTFRRKHTKA